MQRTARLFTRLAAFALAIILLVVPARAQEQSFAAFEAELWPDAQAKGITRATFDTAAETDRRLSTTKGARH